MPLPIKKDGEEQDKFMARCMKSDAIKEFKTQKQKVAVCYSQYRKRKKNSNGEIVEFDMQEDNCLITFLV